MDTITQSTKRMPFAVRFLARELLAATQAKFPEAVGAHPAPVGRLVFYRYINPAVMYVSLCVFQQTVLTGRLLAARPRRTTS